MKTNIPGACQFLIILLVLSLSELAINAASLVKARDGSGVVGYKDTPKLPWCNFLVHDPDRPSPRRVAPGTPLAFSRPPADAIVLFDGGSLSQWQDTPWKVIDGCIESAGTTSLVTRGSFGNCQIHIEWMVPAGFQGPWSDRGNNGVMLMGLYEIQIFDSWNEKIYADGQAGAVYGQTPPLVNACLPPGQWQTYDIVFTAPVFSGEKLLEPARVTLFHNGLLAHQNQEIFGEIAHRALPEYRRKVSKGPLSLAGHNCPVRFRNIWLRVLQP